MSTLTDIELTNAFQRGMDEAVPALKKHGELDLDSPDVQNELRMAGLREVAKEAVLASSPREVGREVRPRQVWRDRLRKRSVLIESVDKHHIYTEVIKHERPTGKVGQKVAFPIERFAYSRGYDGFDYQFTVGNGETRND